MTDPNNPSNPSGADDINEVTGRIHDPNAASDATSRIHDPNAEATEPTTRIEDQDVPSGDATELLQDPDAAVVGGASGRAANETASAAGTGQTEPRTVATEPAPTEAEPVHGSTEVAEEKKMPIWPWILGAIALLALLLLLLQSCANNQPEPAPTVQESKSAEAPAMTSPAGEESTAPSPATEFTSADPSAATDATAEASAAPAEPGEQATSAGLVETNAQAACEEAFNEKYPDGLDIEWATGKKAEIVNDEWKFDVEATGAAGTEAEGATGVVCVVAGANDAPEVKQADTVK